MRCQVLKLALITTGLLLLPVLLWRVPFVQHYLSHAHQWQDNPRGWVWFCLFGIIYGTLGLSRQALCFAAGLGFGFGRGLVFCTLAYEAAACLNYLWARGLGRKYWKRETASDQMKLWQLAEICRASPFLSVLSLRCLPIGSALLVSMAAGAAELSFWKFASATLIGGLPQTLIFTLMGAGTSLGRFNEIFLSVALFLVSSLAGWVGVKRFRQKQAVLKKTSFQSWPSV